MRHPLSAGRDTRANDEPGGARAASCGLAAPPRCPEVPEPFDLDVPMAAILAQGGLSLVDAAVDSFGREFDAGNDNLMVHGPLPAGAVVRGQRSVLIQGEVSGQSDMPCRIEVPGDVVITGDVAHAHIAARRLYLGASVHCSQLTAASAIEVSGDVERCRLLCGDYFADLDGARAREATLEEARQRADELRQRVAVEEKRLAKACGSMRAPLSLNVGRIITHRPDAVTVDLGTFYRSVEWQTDEELERALNEFFAKGIVGVLARMNRKYLVEVPTRGKVFMQLMRGLQELLLQVMASDAAERHAVRRELELERLIHEMETREPRVSVGGSVAPSVRLEFILPRVIRQADGSIDFAHKSAQLTIHAGAFADRLELAWQGGDGSRAERSVRAGDLDGAVFQIRDQQVRWERVTSPVLA